MTGTKLLMGYVAKEASEFENRMIETLVSELFDLREDLRPLIKIGLEGMPKKEIERVEGKMSRIMRHEQQYLRSALSSALTDFRGNVLRVIAETAKDALERERERAAKAKASPKNRGRKVAKQSSKTDRPKRARSEKPVVNEEPTTTTGALKGLSQNG